MYLCATEMLTVCQHETNENLGGESTL